MMRLIDAEELEKATCGRCVDFMEGTEENCSKCIAAWLNEIAE